MWVWFAGWAHSFCRHFFAVLVIWIEWRKCRKRGKRNVLIQNRNVSSEWEQRGRKERSQQQQQQKTRDDTVLDCCVSMVQRDEIVNVPVCWNSLRARGTLFLSLQFHVLVHSRMPAAFHYPLRLSLPCCPFFLLFSFLRSSLPFCAH